MINETEFFSSVLEAVRKLFPEDPGNEMIFEIQDVTKSNDRVLHGLVIKKESDVIAPVLYLEDALEMAEDGTPIDDIARGLVDCYMKATAEMPTEEEISLEYEAIKSRLTLHLEDATLNRDRLREAVYRDLGNSFVMLPYVVMREDDIGSMAYMITKDIAKGENYDLDSLFSDAMKNMTEKFEAKLIPMMDILFNCSSQKETNPLKPGFDPGTKSDIYILTNSRGAFGSVALYYPGMLFAIGNALNRDYYILPSSTNELIILPDTGEYDIGFLKDMVKNANETVVDEKDLLSYRVLRYDRVLDRLYEPMVNN